MLTSQIFVSSWIQKIYAEMGLNTEKSKVIYWLDTKVFNNSDKNNGMVKVD